MVTAAETGNESIGAKLHEEKDIDGPFDNQVKFKPS